MNLALAASQLFSKLEGRIWKRGRESGRERKGNSSRNEGGWKRGRAGVRGRDGKWRGREGLVQYLLRLPAPPAPPSLGTFCCGLSTSCA